MVRNFIAIDGDDVGNILRDHIVSNDIQGASEYSRSLDNFFNEIELELRNKGCEIVFCGGDSILAIAENQNAIEFILGISNPIHPMSPFRNRIIKTYSIHRNVESACQSGVIFRRSVISAVTKKV